MNTVFIIDEGVNPSLVRFTQCKLWYNYENQATMWVKDCHVVKDISEVWADDCIVIASGDYCTTGIREDYVNVKGINDLRSLPGLLKFDKNYEYRTDKKPPYKQGDKQLYIIQNLYKTVIKSRNLIYLSNTDDITCTVTNKHFYGLASGFKSIQYLMENGIDKFEQITIFDNCQRQLDFAQHLHSLSELPYTLTVDMPYYGEFSPSQEIRDYWPTYHKANIKFEKIDLFQAPTLLPDSFITASNIFTYEPNIFLHGWNKCKEAYNQLVKNNPDSTIKTNTSVNS